jgi:hypothetical protein
MKRLLTFTLLSLFYWPSAVSAEYVVVLKNGRRITVQSYREEGSVIKFRGLGGEIGISKDQIQSIQKDDDQARPSTSFKGLEPTPPPAKGITAENKKITPPSHDGKAANSEEALAAQKAKEEKEYQEKLRELTERLKELRDRYAAETRGNTGPEPLLFTSEEAFRGHQDDLISRLRDAQKIAPGPGPAVVTPQAVPPLYTDRQKVLSELRNQIYELEKQRAALIEEMRQKKFDTGSLFLD